MNDMTWWQFVGTIVVVVGGLGTWMRLTIKDAVGGLEKRMDQRFDSVEKRIGNLEEGQRILFAHLIGTNPSN